jgi:hypothetical protein
MPIAKVAAHDKTDYPKKMMIGDWQAMRANQRR